jgi:hypothetical protein
MTDINLMSDNELILEYHALDHAIYELQSYSVSDMDRWMLLSDEIDARGIDIYENV